MDTTAEKIPSEWRRPIVLTKTFTRDAHTLMYFKAWDTSEATLIYPWYDKTVDNLLFMRERNSNKVSIWYHTPELDWFYRRLPKKIARDPEYYPRLKTEFNQHWNALRPYVQGHTKVTSIEELEAFYQNLVLWWVPMAIVLMIPDCEEIPASIKADSLDMRIATQEFSSKLDEAIISFLEKNYPEYTDLVYVMTPDEVFSLKHRKLSGSRVREIRRRLSGYCIFHAELFLPERLSEKLVEHGATLEGEKVDRKNEILRGSPASPGKISGKVRLIMYKDDAETLEEGEVLVTEMTSPEYVPSMRRAAAIVTDEGGVTCHAAIASRELGKPCVIGVKNATRILHTGDLVEVDANRGTVRILK